MYLEVCDPAGERADFGFDNSEVSVEGHQAYEHLGAEYHVGKTLYCDEEYDALDLLGFRLVHLFELTSDAVNHQEQIEHSYFAEVKKAAATLARVMKEQDELNGTVYPYEFPNPP